MHSVQCNVENSVKLETLSDLERYFNGNSSSSTTLTEIDHAPTKRTTIKMLNTAIEDHNKENSVKLETLSDLERYFNENSSKFPFGRAQMERRLARRC